MNQASKKVNIELNKQTADELEWASAHLTNLVKKEVAVGDIIEVALSLALQDLKEKSGSSKLATKLYQQKNYGLEKGSEYSGVWVL